MRKTILLAGFFAVISLFSFGQDSWIRLNEPQTGILGRQIKELKGGDVKFNVDMETPSITTLITDGPDYTKEYHEQFSKLLIPVFTKSKLDISDIELKRTKIKYIIHNDFRIGNLQPGTSFAYEGITADTIRVKVKYQKGRNIKPGEILDSFKSYIPQTTALGGVASKVVNLVSKVEIKGTDSLYDVYEIYNPDVFFRVRIITLLEGVPPKLRSGGRTWDDYWKHFWTRGNSSTTTQLYTNKLPIDRTSVEQYPEVWGGNDPKSRVYFFKVLNSGANLRLAFMRKFSSAIVQLKEIPYTIVNGKKHWELDYDRVDAFPLNGYTKVIFLACVANQIDDNTVELINYRDNTGDKNKIATYMKYPEYKYNYITKL